MYQDFDGAGRVRAERLKIEPRCGFFSVPGGEGGRFFPGFLRANQVPLLLQGAMTDLPERLEYLF